MKKVKKFIRIWFIGWTVKAKGDSPFEGMPIKVYPRILTPLYWLLDKLGVYRKVCKGVYLK